MAVEEIINVLSTTPEIAADIVRLMGQIGLWLKAIGVIVIIWLIVHIVSLFFNTKRMREIKVIKQDITRIEEKIDKILSNQEKKKSKDN